MPTILNRHQVGASVKKHEAIFILKILYYHHPALQRQIETISVTTMALPQELDTSAPGSHLLDVQENFQNFQLQESQVLTWDTINHFELGYNIR